MDLDLTGLERSAFLDSLGRFAKDTSQVALVRLWFSGDSPATYTELTYAEYRALDSDQRTAILEAGSAVGYVDTEGLSNA